MSTTYHKTELVEFTPEKAKEWLDNFNYHNQRPISPSTVRYYAEEMKNGLWMQNSSIQIHDIRNGINVLADGQHRLYAIVKAGVPVTIKVDYYLTDNLQNAFLAIDEHRSRTAGQRALNAGIHKDFNLSPTNASKLVGTVRSAIRHVNKTSKVHPRQYLDIARNFGVSMSEILEMSNGSIEARKRLLLNPNVLWVALATVSQDKDNMKFWENLAFELGNGGFNSPSSRLFYWHLAQDEKRAGRRGGTRYSIATCTAFKAWQEGRELQRIIIKKTSTPTIKGIDFSIFKID